jgi:hypothetical protein
MKTRPAALADSLEALLAGRLTPEEFRRAYPFRAASGETEQILANIEHFLSDADIRARNPRYKSMQEGALEQVIVALRSGDIDAAGRISLLVH